MPQRVRESRSRTLARFAGIAVAFALTVVAVWMIALGHSQRQVSLGVITGLWAALIGAMTFYGGRHAGAGPVTSSGDASATGLELREDFALELQREVSARRAYEQQLHEMVRREIETIQRVVGDQLGRLREDVSSLRGDLVDQVGGKIRLERIETTRVIGSDIEALQNEVRQLAGYRISEGMNTATTTSTSSSRIVDATPAEVPVPVESPALGFDPYGVGPKFRPQVTPRYEPYVAPDYTRPVPAAADAEPGAAIVLPTLSAGAAPTLPAAPTVPTVPAQPIQPAPTFARPEYPPAAPPAVGGPVSEPQNGRVEYAPAGYAQYESVPSETSVPAVDYGSPTGSGNSDDGDPFANLPRLSRFDDSIVSAPTLPPLTYPAAPAAADVEPQRPVPPPPVNGEASRHAAPEGSQPSGEPAEAGGGRRRRVEGDANDVLARLLDNR